SVRQPHLLFLYRCGPHRDLHSFPTRRSSDLRPSPVPRPPLKLRSKIRGSSSGGIPSPSSPTSTTTELTPGLVWMVTVPAPCTSRSEEHTSELQSRENLVCRLLLEKKKNK